MFKKFAQLEDRTERLELFNLLKFNLQILLRLAELLSLAALASGPAWRLGTVLAQRAGQAAGAVLAIGLMALILALVRLPFLYSLGSLNAAFGLDPRPTGRFLKWLIKGELIRCGLLWLISSVLFLGLAWLNLWLWITLGLVLGALGLVCAALNPFWGRKTPREPQPGELSPNLVERLDKWSPKTGLTSGDILISDDFSPGLKKPWLVGLGRRVKIIIPEKALCAFKPEQLGLLTVSAMVERLAKAPEKMLLLRLSALAVAVPLAGILISLAGPGLWGYPIHKSPALMTMVWLAGWVAFGLGEISIRMTRRSLETQASAVAALLLKNEDSLPQALETFAERNLEQDSPSAIIGFFSPHYDRKRFMKQVRRHQHLAKFKEE